MIRFDSIRFDSIRFDSIRFDLIYQGRETLQKLLILKGPSKCNSSWQRKVEDNVYFLDKFDMTVYHTICFEDSLLVGLTCQ